MDNKPQSITRPTESFKALSPTGGGIVGFGSGATYPLRALRLLQRYPQLRGYVLWPIVLNILLGGTVYAGAVWWGSRRIALGMAALPDWLQWIGWLIQPVLWLLLLIATGLILLQFGGLLGSPLYGMLSEKLETIQTGKPPADQPFSLTLLLWDLWRAIAFELKKLLLFFCGVALLFALGFVPGIGVAIAPFGGVAIATVIICLDFFDAPLERRRLRFRQKLGIVFRTLPASASFGLVCLGLVSIPLLNLLAIPLCVTAGTMFFCDRIVGE